MNRGIEFKFNDVIERDIDLLIIEELAYSKDFCKLFLNKIKNKDDFEIVSLEHSQFVNGYGESDIVVIYETAKGRFALLIEDKINAEAQNCQCERYGLRGDIGVKAGQYDGYAVFIIAPQNYLDNDLEAKKYPNRISYEEILDYFKKYNEDNRAKFKIQQIEQSIFKKKSTYQCTPDEEVTDFWHEYVAYQRKHYPLLPYISGDKERGAKSSWPTYKSDLIGFELKYKIKHCHVEIQATMPEHLDVEVFELLNLRHPNYQEEGIYAERRVKRKTLYIGIETPFVDTKKSFWEQIELIKPSFEAVEKLLRLGEEIELYKFKNKRS